MDERDLVILQAAVDLGTGSPEEIATQTDIPKSTVHYRLNKLKERGVVSNDLLNLDLAELGLDITIVTEVIADYGPQYHKEVGQALTEIEGVNQVYFTMGDTDFVVIAHLSEREMVQRLIADYEAIEEVERTSSQFVVETLKDEPNPISDFDLDTLVDSLIE